MPKPPRSSTRSSSRTRRASQPTTRSPSNAAPPRAFDLSESIGELDDCGDDTWDAFAARGHATMKTANPATVAARAPWVKGGVDYGPARAAFKDLAVWALDLAERDVADVLADRKRIRNVRGAILGNTSREPSTRDVMFTAQVLARVFDRDLGLGLSDQLAIFEELDLSTDVLPLWLSTPRAPTPLEGRAPTRIPTPAHTEPVTTTVQIRFETVSAARIGASPPPPLRFCDECGYLHEPGEHVHYRNAA